MASKTPWRRPEIFIQRQVDGWCSCKMPCHQARKVIPQTPSPQSLADAHERDAKIPAAVQNQSRGEPRFRT